jgi:hypothetical protein
VLASTARYLAFALLAIVAPGMGLQRLARVGPEAALVLPLGILSAAFAYWTSLILGLPWLGPLLLALLGAALLLPRPVPSDETASPAASTVGPPRSAIAPFLAIVALLALTQYRWNRLAPSGELLLDGLVPFDSAFHVGLTRELTLQYPPEVPGVSGFPLGYHLGTDLVRAAALRWAAIDPYDAISRFDVTLGALALVLVLPAAARAAGASAAVARIVPWTLLATDFSFALFANPQAHWWADLLRGNLLLSLCLANPIVPGLALTLGSLVAWSRFGEQGRRGWLALAALQAAAVPMFKVFLGPHLVLGLVVAAVRGRRLPILAMALPCLLTTAALALGQGGRTVEVALDPLDLVRVTRESLAVPVASGLALVGWAVPWLLASLGLRVLGVAPALKAVRSGPPVGSALGVMALAAWPLGLLLRVSAPQALSGQRVVNDAAFLVEQGGPLLWIFAAITLGRLASRHGALVWVVAGMLALPSTLHFAIKKALLPPDPLPAATVRAMKSLAEVSTPGDVVLQRPGARFPPAPVILIGRRVPYERFTPYLTQFAPAPALEQRHETVYRFFHTEDPAEAEEIARALDARFVCLYGGDRVRFDSSRLLEAIHEEPGARVYRIRYSAITAGPH